MADNLLQMAEQQLGSSGLSTLDSVLNIPEGKGKSALQAGMATGIAGMLKKGTDRSGLGSLLNMVTGSKDLDLSSADQMLKDPDRLNSLQESGGNMLDQVFGNKQGNVVQAFSSSLGLKGGAGGSAMKVIMPLLVSMLGKHARSKNLDMGGLATTLLEQKPFIKDKLPGDMLQELGVTNFEKLGEGARAFSRGHAEPQAARTPEQRGERTPEQRGERMSAQRGERAPEERKRSNFGKWFWPLLIALAALYALNMCARKERMEDKPGEAVMEDRSVITGEAAKPPATQTPPATPDAAQQPGDFASNFRDYLSNTARDPNREFPLAVQFSDDSAQVAGQSSPDVDALAKIMQEHPGLTVAIEGHTSSEGDEAKNQQLSEERAEAVRQMLVDKGINGNRVSAVGMGSAKPIADDSTQAGKEKNRRVSVRVVNFE